MQLRLNEDELKLLAEILESRDAELRGPASRPYLPGSGGRVPEADAAQQILVLGLLQHVIDRELGLSSEELDALAALLAEQLDKLREEISRTPEPAREELRRQQVLLSQLLDKVTEACAMA